MRFTAVLGVVALLLVAGCGGDETSQATETTAGDVSFEISGVPREQTRVWSGKRQPGPPRGWWVGGEAEFFVATPRQTVEHPARLTFTKAADSFDDFTRGRVDQLGVYLPGGLILGTGKSLRCPASGRAEPDPCIASAEFLDNGDGRIVVLASNPSSG